MKKITALLFVIIFASSVFADGIHVTKSMKVNMSAKMAWSIVGAFQGLDRWHPAVVSSESIGDGMNSGNIRFLTLGDGATITEKLLSYYDDEMQLEYAIIDSPLPIKNYVSTIRVQRVGSKAMVTWESVFYANGVSKKVAKNIVSGIYKGGLDSLKKLSK